MPRRDGTGPQGQGAMTGSRMAAGIEPRVGLGNGRRFDLGRGLARSARFGLGLGIGYGCRRMQELRPSAGDDQETLNQEKAMLQRRLERVTDQLNRLSK